jgi:hypothetical protein
MDCILVELRISGLHVCFILICDTREGCLIEKKVIHPDAEIYILRYFVDRLCGLVVRVLGYRFGGPGSIPGTTRFSEKKKNSSGSGTGCTQPREYD